MKKSQNSSNFSTSTPMTNKHGRYRPTATPITPSVRPIPKLLSPKAAVKKTKKTTMKASKRFTDLMIPKLPFARLVRDVVRDMSLTELRWNGVALVALQEATEIFMTNLLEDAYLITLHSKRVTLMVHDIQLVRRIQRLQF